MKYGSSLFFVFSLLLFVSCRDKDENRIDMLNGLSNNISTDFQTLYKDYELITLKNSDMALYAGNPHILLISDSGIVIQSKENLFRFMREGEFQNRIGEYGNGHAEHGKILSACCDSLRNEVYVATFSFDIFVYSFDGEYIRKFRVDTDSDEYLRSICFNPSLGLVCDLRSMKEGQYVVCLGVADENGKIRRRYPIYSDSERFVSSRESFSLCYNYGKATKFKLDFDTKLYRIEGNNVDFLDLYCGKQAPDRRLIEDARLKSDLYSNYVQILDIGETSKYFYFLMYYEEAIHCSIYSKTERRFVFSTDSCNPKRDGGVALNGCPTGVFWPSYVSSTMAATLLFGEHITKDGISGIGGLDSDPVILIAKE